MAIQTAPVQEAIYKFSVAQFEQMISEGVFAEDDRVELLNGEVVKMTPINHPHAATVSKLEFISREMLGRAAYVWAQQPIVLDDRSRPQPDVALLKWREDFYIPKRPTAEDVLLLIEVADTSLASDRGRKRARYARAGIAEYWIVNLQDRVVEVYSNPEGDKYANAKIAAIGETLPLPGGLQGAVSVDEILGQTKLRS